MENFKTVEHRARRIGATITLEVGDRGTIMHDGRMLASFVMDRRHGYCYCRLPGAGFPGLLPVHRLVAQAWCPNPDGLPFVDHIDSDRTNNSAENLRWVSRKQNNSTGHSRRMKSKNAKHSDRRNQVIRMEKDGVSKLAANGYVAAEMIGCSHVLVYNVLNPSHWAKSAKGWRLEWVDLDAPE